MDWIPIVFVTFKMAVLVTGMFFAIKWHYDQGKKEKVMDTRALLRAGGKAAAIFVVLLGGIGLATFALIKVFGMEL